MGPYGSRDFKTLLLLQISAERFQTFLFLNFLPKGPHKTVVGIFELLKMEILMIFLALLDYVSRAHEIEISPWSVVCRPFVRHPSVRVAIISEPNARISFKFGCCFLWDIRSDLFRIFDFFFFFFFLILGTYGRKKVKTLLFLQIAAESFQTFSEFSSQWSSQNYGFEILKVEILMIFFSFFLTWGPYGSQNIKTLLLPPITFESFQTFFFWIFFSVVLTKVLFWTFEILSFRFLKNFLNSPLYLWVKPKTSIIWKRSDRRAKRSEKQYLENGWS